MKSKLVRTAGLLMLVVFAINIYLGIADSYLRQFNILHYYLDWVIAAVSVVAAALLLAQPKKVMLVSLGGIAWPIVYLASLATDVLTRLCLGASSSSCWPSKTAAFDYLILNYSSIPNAPGYGWKLLPGIMPLDIAILAIVFVLSVISVLRIRRGKMVTKVPAAPP